MQEVLAVLEALKEENERLKQGNTGPSMPTQPGVLAYTGRVFYRIEETTYLDEPRWEPAEGGSVVLMGYNPIRNLDYFLDQHPEIAFAIYKEYSKNPPSDRSKIETTDGVYRPPTPSYEFLSLEAPAMLDAIEEFVQQVPNFGDYFPYFEPEGQILAPYFFMYYSTSFIPDILPKLEVSHQNLIKQLQTVIDKGYGYEYESAKLQAQKGMVARQHLKYLFRPGEVLVGKDSVGLQAYIATGWIDLSETVHEDAEYEHPDSVQRRRIPRYGPLANTKGNRKLKTYIWTVPAWRWEFNGIFEKRNVNLKVRMSIGYDEESVDIASLNVHPLKYAADGTKTLLERRGRTFWAARHRKFVAYIRSDDDELHNVSAGNASRSVQS